MIAGFSFSDHVAEPENVNERDELVVEFARRNSVIAFRRCNHYVCNWLHHRGRHEIELSGNIVAEGEFRKHHSFAASVAVLGLPCLADRGRLSASCSHFPFGCRHWRRPITNTRRRRERRTAVSYLRQPEFVRIVSPAAATSIRLLPPALVMPLSAGDASATGTNSGVAPSISAARLRNPDLDFNTGASFCRLTLAAEDTASRGMGARTGLG